MFQSILCIEAERNYCRIFTKTKEYLPTMPMKTLEEELPRASFHRIHLSYIVNLSRWTKWMKTR